MFSSGCPAADGTEGGRHHLISAAVDSSNGRLNIINVQIGEKRFVKGGPTAEVLHLSYLLISVLSMFCALGTS